MAQQSEAFGEFLKERLRERRVSPRDVARMSANRISHMTVNEAMRGVVPSPRKLVVLALTLGDDPDRYFEAAGEPFRYTGERDLARVICGELRELVAGPRSAVAV